jgi:filamentous hemagglutinin
VGSFNLGSTTTLNYSFAAKGTMADANFAQIGINRAGTFSAEGVAKYSALAGRPIATADDLAVAITEGSVKASQVTVDYVVVKGQKVILNTRTSTALNRAGVPQSEWIGKNVTGLEVPGMPGVTFDDLALQQTIRSKLPPTGTSTAPK